MQFVDHIFILLLFVVLPIYGTFDTPRYLARIEAGQSANRTWKRPSCSGYFWQWWGLPGGFLVGR